MQANTEAWAPVWDLRVRFAACGHTELRSKVPIQADKRSTYSCPVCGVTQDTEHPQFVSRDFVPTSLLLSWGRAKKTDIHDDKLSYAKGGARTLRDLVSAVSSRGVAAMDLQGSAVSAGALGQEGAEMVVVRGNTCGALVKNGSVAAPTHGAIVLDGCGAHFQDIQFSGGAIIVVGKGFSGSFLRCRFTCTVCVTQGAAATFTGCSFHPPGRGIVASGLGTAATLTSCQFSGSFNAVIGERGAAVHLRHCDIRDAHVGMISNCARTHIHVQDCTIQLTTHDTRIAKSYGVRSYDGSVTVRRSCMKGYTHAVHASGCTGHALCEVIDSAIEGADACVSSGVLLSGGARACMRRSCVRMPNGTSDDSDAAVEICPEVEPHAEECGSGAGEGGGRCEARSASAPRFSGSPESPESPVYQEVSRCGAASARRSTPRRAGHLQMERCSVHAAKADTLYFRSANVSAMLCKVHAADSLLFVGGVRMRTVLQHCACYSFGMADQPACMLRAGEVWLNNTCIDARWSAIGLHGGAMLCAVDSVLRARDKVSDGQSSVLFVRARSTASMHACLISGTEVGVNCKQGSILAKHCDVRPVKNASKNGGDAGKCMTPMLVAYAAEASSASISGGAIDSCGVGVHVSNELSEEAVVSGVKVSECKRGVRANGARVAVSDCEFSCTDATVSHDYDADWESADNSAIFLDDNACGVVRGCVVSGFHVGVGSFAKEPQRVEVAKCEFYGGKQGVSLQGRNVPVKGNVSACKFHDMKVGVCAFACNASVSACAFTQVRSSVIVNSGAAVTVHDCSFEECFRGLDMPTEGTVVLRDCRMHGGDTGVLCMSEVADITLDRVSMDTMDCCIAMQVEAADPPLSTCMLRVMHCSLSSCEAGVQTHGRAVHASVEHTTLRKCVTAVKVGDSSSGEFRHVTVSDSEIGVTCGPSQFSDFQEEPCAVCGLSGRASGAAAWDAVRAAHALPPLAEQPRCMHEGARSRTLIEDCVVRTCSLVGLIIDPHGRVVARRMRLVGCKFGVREEVLGQRSTFEDCEVVVAGGERITQETAVAYVQKESGPDYSTDYPEDIPGIRISEPETE